MTYGWGVTALILGMVASGADVVAAQEPAPIAITPSDGFNLEVVDQVDPHYVVVRIASPAHNWFAGLFTNLPTDAETTIGLSLAGNDTTGNRADVTKWVGLVPVMTYADPTKYESYECFEKGKDGMWRSTDILKSEKDREAGNGKCPVQTVIPAELAEEFLSRDGTSWEPWREVEKAEAQPATNAFRVTHHFRQATATVAMRVPYLPSYQQLLVERLARMNLPAVRVDDLGQTLDGRRLHVVRVGNEVGTSPPTGHKTVLVTAREHAGEQASSWAVHGALRHIVEESRRQALRPDVLWLVILLQFPDEAADPRLQQDPDCFGLPRRGMRPEPILYSRYLVDHVDEGRTIDIAVSVHNVEANEGPNLFSPFFNAARTHELASLNKVVFGQASHTAYKVGVPDTPWDRGALPTRMAGWCAMHFGTLDVALEVNDRYPPSRLSLERQQKLGTALAVGLCRWLASTDGDDLHAAVTGCLKARSAEQEHYWKSTSPRKGSALHDLLVRGFRQPAALRTWRTVGAQQSGPTGPGL